MISAKNIIYRNTASKKALILAEVDTAEIDKGGVDGARELSKVINTFVADYFELKIQQDLQRRHGSILSSENLQIAVQNEINQFKPNSVAMLSAAMPTRQEILRSSKNIYEMFGAVKLASGNKATRSLSTGMGLLWERLANLSPYTINPESEFGLKIVGIDLIALNVTTRNIEYQQIKTQHNTLTGSQIPRSISELEIHDHPVFCACFSNKSNWTFRHPTIPRVSGTDFWGRIGIPYEVILANAQNLILELEAEYTKLL